MTGDRGRQLAKKTLSVLKRTHGTCAANAKNPALEELLLGILAEGSSERRASSALSALSKSFVDWNEVRVSSACDIASAMPDLPDAVEKSVALRAVLQRVYDVTNEMALEFLNDKSPRDISRFLADIENFPENALARAALLALKHDVMPLTTHAVAVLKRLGLLNDNMDHADMAGELKKFVPGNHMFDLHWLLTRHAAQTCLPQEPKCGECGLRADCKTGKTAVNNIRRCQAKRQGR